MDNILFISHRINTKNELKNIPREYGVEIDLRDRNDKIILQHDPFIDGEDFSDFIKNYQHQFLILNIKSEGIEFKILNILKQYNIENYFFLDSSFPMIYKLSKITNKIAIRYSEFESLDSVLNMKGKVQWVWIDCFSKFPLNKNTYQLLKKDFKLCYVSPELQQQYSKIIEYKNLFLNKNLIPDAICSKIYNINLYKKKRIISFSLWGKIRLYCIGAIKNALLAQKYFPEWICRFYYDSTVPLCIINYLNSLKNTELYFISQPSGGIKYKDSGQFGMLWRYYPILDQNVEIFLARDIDSRLSPYEYQIINNFIKSKNKIHNFREKNEPFCRGGTFSFKNFSYLQRNSFDLKKYLSKINSIICPFYTDEKFLNNFLYPEYKSNYSYNTRYFNDSCNIYGSYVGQVLDEYDQPIDKNSDSSFNQKQNFQDLNIIISNYKQKLI